MSRNRSSTTTDLDKYVLSRNRSSTTTDLEKPLFIPLDQPAVLRVAAAKRTCSLDFDNRPFQQNNNPPPVNYKSKSRKKVYEDSDKLRNEISRLMKTQKVFSTHLLEKKTKEDEDLYKKLEEEKEEIEKQLLIKRKQQLEIFRILYKRDRKKKECFNWSKAKRHFLCKELPNLTVVQFHQTKTTIEKSLFGPDLDLLHYEKHWEDIVSAKTISTYPLLPGETQKRDGDPICDRYLIYLRENCTILAVADGCNWGKRPAAAAKTATFSFLHHMKTSKTIPSIKKAGSILISAFAAAHQKILDSGADVYDAGTATLLGGIMLRLETDVEINGNTKKWVFVCASVGDCKALCFSPKNQNLVDITAGNRLNLLDPTDCGGRLGPHLEGGLPDLRNFQIFHHFFEEDDFLLVMTDGVHDNLDPQLLGLRPFDIGFAPREDVRWRDLPMEQIKEAKISHQNRLLKEIILGCLKKHNRFTAREITQEVIDYCENLTENSRDFMQRNPGKQLPEDDYAQYPGKMDHTTFVALQVKPFPQKLLYLEPQPEESTFEVSQGTNTDDTTQASSYEESIGLSEGTSPNLEDRPVAVTEKTALVIDSVLGSDRKPDSESRLFSPRSIEITSSSPTNEDYLGSPTQRSAKLRQRAPKNRLSRSQPHEEQNIVDQQQQLQPPQQQLHNSLRLQPISKLVPLTTAKTSKSSKKSKKSPRGEGENKKVKRRLSTKLRRSVGYSTSPLVGPITSMDSITPKEVRPRSNSEDQVQKIRDLQGTISADSVVLKLLGEGKDCISQTKRSGSNQNTSVIHETDNKQVSELNENNQNHTQSETLIEPGSSRSDKAVDSQSKTKGVEDHKSAIGFDRKNFMQYRAKSLKNLSVLTKYDLAELAQKTLSLNYADLKQKKKIKTENKQGVRSIGEENKSEQIEDWIEEGERKKFRSEDVKNDLHLFTKQDLEIPYIDSKPEKIEKRNEKRAKMDKNGFVSRFRAYRRADKNDKLKNKLQGKSHILFTDKKESKPTLVETQLSDSELKSKSNTLEVVGFSADVNTVLQEEQHINPVETSEAHSWPSSSSNSIETRNLFQACSTEFLCCDTPAFWIDTDLVTATSVHLDDSFNDQLINSNTLNEQIAHNSAERDLASRREILSRDSNSCSENEIEASGNQNEEPIIYTHSGNLQNGNYFGCFPKEVQLLVSNPELREDTFS